MDAFGLPFTLAGGAHQDFAEIGLGNHRILAIRWLPFLARHKEKKMSHGVPIFISLGCSLLISACDFAGPRSARGFRLPDGDAEAGRMVYVEKQCGACHAIAGKEELREGIELEMTVPIGGMQTRIDTYGKLVTSVINPSHKVARSYRTPEYAEDEMSKMRNYNGEMTVSELIDLVAFLQAQYEEFPDY